MPHTDKTSEFAEEHAAHEAYTEKLKANVNEQARVGWLVAEAERGEEYAHNVLLALLELYASRPDSLLGGDQPSPPQDLLRYAVLRLSKPFRAVTDAKRKSRLKDVERAHLVFMIMDRFDLKPDKAKQVVADLQHVDKSTIERAYKKHRKSLEEFYRQES